MLSSPSGHFTFAAALLDPGRPVPAQLRASNGSDVAARFAVHRNNVVASLVGVLADTFPVVQQLVGDEFFRALAREFVREQPPRSPVMLDYGETFPAWLAAFEPATAWPCLADVARLEFARLRAFHAADAAAVEATALAGAMAEPQRLASMALALHPSLAVVASAHPIVSLWAAHQLADAERDAALERIGLAGRGAGETALVLRHDDDALVLRIARADGELARRLQAGAPLAEALAKSPSADFAPLLALLLRHGAVTALLHPGDDRGLDTAPQTPAEKPT
ncbi:MAG: putative DNA-binding domain-containing protein [Rubrivivax sp.]|nr:putative DNA-binding domain-containing protein [Rubrivivax sp.]